jgi:hypothetical protein
MAKITDPNPLPPTPTGVRQPSVLPARTVAFSSRLEVRRPAAEMGAGIRGSDVVSRGLAEASAKDFNAAATRAETRAVLAGEAHIDNAHAEAELFKDNPFGPPDPREVQTTLTMMSQAEAGSLNSRLLRLQYRLQRESARFMFASNTLKGDRDDKKELISNIR